MKKTITGYKDYTVTKTGKVYSKHCQRFLCSRLRGGYQSVALYKNKVRKDFPIHRLVLTTFVGSAPKGMQCRHLNGNKQDNRLDNLKWGTAKENSDDSKQHGTMNQAKGECAGQSKLTEKVVKLIRMLYHFKWLQFRQWELGKIFGVDQTTIHYIVIRRSWKHV